MGLLSTRGTDAGLLSTWLPNEPRKLFSKGKVKKAGGSGNLCSGLVLFPVMTLGMSI